jgi:hypothetical protein
MEKFVSHWTDFRVSDIYFSKLSRENSGLKRIWQEYRIIYMEIKIYFWSYIAQFFLESELFQTKVVEKIKTYIKFDSIFSSNIVPYMRQCGNILQIRAGHRLEYGACGLHAVYLWLQALTIRICNIFAFPLQQCFTNAPKCYFTVHCLHC